MYIFNFVMYGPIQFINDYLIVNRVFAKNM